MPAFGPIHRSKSETQGLLSRRGGGIRACLGLLFPGQLGLCVKRHFVQYLDCSVKLHFFALFRSVPFRASELALPWNSECLGMSTFFRGIKETIPSLFRGSFSERNSVPNPRLYLLSMVKGLCYRCTINCYPVPLPPFSYTFPLFTACIEGR